MRQLRLGTPTGKSNEPMSSMFFGPPYTLAFWIRMDSSNACFDIFSATSTTQRWNSINVWVRGYVQKDPFGFPFKNDQAGMLDRSDRFGNHIIVQHKPESNGNSIVGRISSQPLPMGVWRYVVIRCVKATNFRTATSMAAIETPLLKLSILTDTADTSSLQDIGKIYSKHWSYHNERWHRGAKQIKTVSRNIVLGGRYMCKTDEGPAGFGSFSLSDFTMHTSRALTNEEILVEFRYGSTRGESRVIPSHANALVTSVPLNKHVPLVYEGIVRLRNCFATSPPR